MFDCKILADSLAPCGARLTTWQVTLPRPIWSEVLTHRDASRNCASSRAIPTEKLIQRVLDDPWIPLYIGQNQKGMQAGAELPESLRIEAVATWLQARDRAVEAARKLVTLGVHKQIVNRVIEPYMWVTAIVSMTEVDNFFGLRDHPDAEPHFQHIARMMRADYNASTPRVLAAGEWHLPLFDDVDRETIAREDWPKVSMGRCARVSYLTHDGKRDPAEDIKLYERLAVQKPLHASPAEHVAQAMDWPEWWKETCGFMEGESPSRLRAEVVGRLSVDREIPGMWTQEFVSCLAQMQSGNFLGFKQLRKTLKDETIGGPRP